MRTLHRGIWYGGVLATLLFIACSAAKSDSSFERAIRLFGANDVKGYIQPLSDVFGANMAAGWYHSAAIPAEGLHISFNIITMGSVVGDDQKFYTVRAPAGFSPGTFRSATVFGGAAGSVTDQNTGLTYQGISEGVLDVPLFPLAALQVGVGSVQGTELIIRGAPLPEVGNAPKVTFFGAGVRHSISQYLIEPPLELAAGIFYNRISFGDLVEMRSFSLGAQASKTFSVVELYGGLGWEKGTMELTYVQSSGPNAPVGLDIGAANTVRFTIGGGLNLSAFHLFVDANFGSVTNFSSGFGFGL